MMKTSTRLAVVALSGVAFLLGACDGGGGRTESKPAAAAALDDGDRLGLADAPMKGNPNAPVTIVEFSSFQCPFCGRVQPTLQQIATEFGDDVRFYFKQHPLPGQAASRPAARAALAAHAQGKFWEYGALLLQNQRELTEENFVGWAEQTGLDVARFNEDRNAEWTEQRVAADLTTAGKFGIRGTPNFLINGRPLTGAQPFDSFAAVIREEITATRALLDGGQALGSAFAARLDANQKAAAAAQAERPTEPDPNQKLRVPVGDSPVKGGLAPLVTIVEFSSYQCPFCNRVRPTIAQLLEEYGDDLRVIFKHRPLPTQANSEPAARAAIAAQNQGKFWEFHAELFDNQARIGDALFTELVEKLHLDPSRFRTDMASDVTAARLRADTTLADQIQASATPHFFINGYRLRGAQPVEAFKAVIDRELAVAKGLVEGGVRRLDVYDKVQADAAERVAAAPAQPAAPAAPVEFNLAGAPSRGPENAAVTVVEFSDFQCGFCGRLAESLAEVMPDYEDRVRFVSMQFPLGRFPHSQQASEAALAAHAQGKYWEYKRLVYQNQSALTEASFEQFAEQVGLDMAKFRADMESKRHAAAVTTQRNEGQRAGVRGTPAMYMNGTQVGGALPAAQLRTLLDGALAKK